MSLQRKALKGASWLAMFKFVSQAISWVVTIIIAWLLLPDDYALSAMATIITGYAEIFSELGLGASIIQREKQNNKDLSSVYWFALLIGCIFALSCIPFSYITAEIFSEEKVIPLTQAVGVLFIFSSLQVVPLNLLKRDVNFKVIGRIEMQCTILSSIGMIVIAYMGGGVWALIGGRILRGVIRTFLLYKAVEWRPYRHFSFSEAKPYLKFGIVVSLGASLFYLFEVADRFFAGRVWPLEVLGFYLFAMQLAKIPTEKIVVLINQVSFPVFARLCLDMNEYRRFYLNVVKITATLVFPTFVGGFLVGDWLIQSILDDKWLPIITMFRFLCLIQIATALNAVNNFVHTSMGHPRLTAIFNGIAVITMSISFYFAVPYGMHAILVPWFTTYLVICVFWIIYTLAKQGIPVNSYLKSLASPAVATILMSVAVLLFRYLTEGISGHNVVLLMSSILIAAAIYLGYMWYFDRTLLYALKNLKKS